MQPNLHYGQVRAPEANGLRIYRSQVRGAKHRTERQQASLWLVNSSLLGGAFPMLQILGQVL